MSLNLTAGPGTELRTESTLTADQQLIITQLANLYLQTQAKIKEHEAYADQLRDRIEEVREESGHQTLQIGDLRVTRINAIRNVLSREKLLAAGVTMAMQADCAEQVPSKPYTKITKERA